MSTTKKRALITLPIVLGLLMLLIVLNTQFELPPGVMPAASGILIVVAGAALVILIFGQPSRG